MSEQNPYLKSIDGVLYSRDGKTLITYPNGKQERQFVVPEGVEELGIVALKGNMYLEILQLPQSLKTVGWQAVSACSSLETVQMQEGLMVIDPEAFCGNESLQQINLPKSLVTIGDKVFATCPLLRFTEEQEANLLIKNKPVSAILEKEQNMQGSTEWFTYACTKDGDCIITGLTEKARQQKEVYRLVLPERIDGKEVTAIAERAFYGVPLVSVALPEGLKEIGTGAFYGCNLADEVRIPKSVIYLGDFSFGANYRLKIFSVDEENDIYTSQDGIIYNKEMTMLLHVPAAWKGSKFTVPDSVQVIGAYAFGNNRQIKELTISSGVRVIEEKAFWNMLSLSRISLPENLIYKAPDALASCPNYIK